MVVNDFLLPTNLFPQCFYSSLFFLRGMAQLPVYYCTYTCGKCSVLMISCVGRTWKEAFLPLPFLLYLRVAGGCGRSPFLSPLRFCALHCMREVPCCSCRCFTNRVFCKKRRRASDAGSNMRDLNLFEIAQFHMHFFCPRISLFVMITSGASDTFL